MTAFTTSLAEEGKEKKLEETLKHWMYLYCVKYACVIGTQQHGHCSFSYLYSALFHYSWFTLGNVSYPYIRVYILSYFQILFFTRSKLISTTYKVRHLVTALILAVVKEVSQSYCQAVEDSLTYDTLGRIRPSAIMYSDAKRWTIR